MASEPLPVADDNFGLWKVLIERLEEQVPNLMKVGVATELADIVAGEIDYPSPAAFVLFGGDDPKDTRLGGREQITEQTWTVVLAVRNVESGRALVLDAGALYAQIRQALQGWKPGADYRALTRVTAPQPRYQPGEGFFPQSYKTQLVEKGN